MFGQQSYWRRRVAGVVVCFSVLILPQAIVAQTEGLETAPESGRYIVYLDEAPVVHYRGGIPGLPATSPQATGDARLQAARPAVIQYSDFLAQRQTELVGTIERQLGRKVPVVQAFRLATNGFSLEISPQEAARVATLSGVKRIEPVELLELMTDAGPAWISADTIWSDSGEHQFKGEGVVVGVLDTGINPDHPSFAETDPSDGYQHINPLGSGNYLGVCDPSSYGQPYDPSAGCNDKLIGIYDYTGDGNTDDNGHGSHVAATVAGNHVELDLSPAYVLDEPLIAPPGSGVAPRANIVAYRICDEGGSCASDSMLRAVDDILQAGVVDVVNFSIGRPGGGRDPWSAEPFNGFLGLHAAGVLVIASAGNSSNPGTVGNFAPWIGTIAASTHNRQLRAETTLTTSGGNAAAPGEIDAMGLTFGTESAQIVSGRHLSNVNPTCTNPSQSQVQGRIVVCQLQFLFSGPSWVTASEELASRGAVGMIVHNTDSSYYEDADGNPTLFNVRGALPTIHVLEEDGEALHDWIEEGGVTVASFGGANMVRELDDAAGDILAGFSSQGPAVAPFDVLIGPNLTAPGVNILAARHSTDDTVANENMVISGTSMSSPHVAGAAALLRGLNPDWTPSEVLSALMLTAEADGHLSDDQVSQATPFQIGSGRVNLEKAAQSGLVLDETSERFASADGIGDGLSLPELNLASLGQTGCFMTCRWTRTLRATRDGQWQASVSADSGVTVEVEPASFTLAAGETQTITVTASGSLGVDDWAFGELLLVDSSGNAADARLPIAVRNIRGPVSRAVGWVNSGLEAPWGMTTLPDGRAWVSDPDDLGGDGAVHELNPGSFSFTGETVSNDWAVTARGSTFADITGTAWQLDRDGDNCLHAWTPDGATGDTLCPDWPAPVQAVTYDFDAQTFWAGAETGELIQFDLEGEVLDIIETDYLITGLAMLPNQRVLALGEMVEGSDLAVLDLRAEARPEDAWYLIHIMGPPAFNPGAHGDLTLLCDGRLLTSNIEQGHIYWVHPGVDATACGDTYMDLDDYWIPSARPAQARELHFRVPGDTRVSGLEWDIHYDASENDNRTYYLRMQIVSPTGESIIAGSYTPNLFSSGSWAGPVDHNFDWSIWSAISTDARAITDFNGQQAGGYWTVRLWHARSGDEHMGQLLENSHIQLNLVSDAPLIEPGGGAFVDSELPLEVRLSSGPPDRFIRYSLDGSDPEDSISVIQSRETITVDADTELRAIAESAEFGTSHESGAVFQFFPAVGIVDQDGSPMDDPVIAAGQSLDFDVSGGSGDIALELLPNSVSGVEADLSFDAGSGTVTIPETGAFAGDYQLLVIDENTGSAEWVTITVPLGTQSELTHLIPEQSSAFSVHGATPGYGFSFQVMQDDMPSSLASLDPDQAIAEGDEGAANPAVSNVTLATPDAIQNFDVLVTPEDGSYDAVSHEWLADPGRHYSGWVEDALGSRLQAATVRADNLLGEDESVYTASSDPDGVFSLRTPSPLQATEHNLTALKQGYLTRGIAGADCAGADPTCTVVMEAASAKIHGSLEGLQAGDRVEFMLLHEEGGIVTELGPHVFHAEEDAALSYRLPADYSRIYQAILATAVGYEDHLEDRGGQGFGFTAPGDEIEQVDFTMNPTTPALLSVDAQAADDGSLDLSVMLEPMARDGSVHLEWGYLPDSLDQSTEPQAYSGEDSIFEAEWTLSDLACGGALHYRAVASNDRGMTATSETTQTALAACASPFGSGSGCSLGQGSQRPDPLWLFLVLLLLAHQRQRQRPTKRNETG
ncbi:S8 family serine peptidase [Natronospira bacteriovora]|uniref:S8 family serine peptidase n=1 Tax=Natronospira bacteriovora TaxID=3069753 RepID=A0ABU0W8Q9_9GAMM|nr:S8 family serine peptidase [Natronospira sp. AB-CW4]MDQ2070337.1 S8 family serine peptidase [Natronospira sp. AB-CW4]